jgi:hypothetical protein
MYKTNNFLTKYEVSYGLHTLLAKPSRLYFCSARKRLSLFLSLLLRKYEPSCRTGNNKRRNMAENGESSCALDFIASNFIALLEFLTWAHSISRELMVFTVVFTEHLFQLSIFAPLDPHWWPQGPCGTLIETRSHLTPPFAIYYMNVQLRACEYIHILKSAFAHYFQWVLLHLLLSMNHASRPWRVVKIHCMHISTKLSVLCPLNLSHYNATFQWETSWNVSHCSFMSEKSVKLKIANNPFIFLSQMFFI